MVTPFKNKLTQVIPSLLLNVISDLNVDDNINGIKAIYLFGSHASGLSHKNSDIDIAVLCHKKLTSVKRWQIQSELANELACEVDLVDLLTASTVMQNQVIQQGICIYDPDNIARLFEMQVMSMYQHLNEERAEIVAEYMGEYS